MYQDANCTISLTSIEWGTLSPGANKTVTIYIRNEGNVNATLAESASNWTPASAGSQLSLTWNYTGQVLSVHQVIPVQFQLSISPTILGITDFGFDLTVAAIQ